jgi:minimal CRISPR polymerase domain
MIESKVAALKPENFDFEFFRKFNDFILYLRNSSTHKSTNLADIESYKAELSVKMSFPFIDFYTDIIYHILKNEVMPDTFKRIKRLSTSEIHPDDTFYFGLDGDDTGTRLEELFLSVHDEASFRKMSNSVTHAILELSKYIREKFSKDSIIFAAGDDILFKGHFNESVLYTLQKMYEKATSGMTCSIGFGRSFKEVYLALKLAKVEPGKNSIMGIELV